MPTPPLRTDSLHDTVKPRSATSWGAILAGAAVALAITVLLLALATGLGLSTVSPYPNAGASATTFTITTGIALILVQWISSSVGGYLAGRLRTKWDLLYTDEAYFRDTAHGLAAWAVATLLGVTVVASSLTSLTGVGAQAVGGLAASATVGVSQGAASSNGSLDPNAYFLDTLFRGDKPNPSDPEAKAEAGRILATSLKNGSLSAPDRTYLAQSVATRTGVSQQDAEKRVDDLVAQAKAAEQKTRDAAETARKASVKLSFFIFFSMLIGAFIAAVSGALGGRLRTEHEGVIKA